MIYSDEILKKIRTMGALGYDAQKVAAVMKPHIDNMDELLAALEDASSDAFEAYQNGLNSRMVNIDIAEYERMQKDTEMAKLELEKKKKYYALKKELFNL